MQYSRESRSTNVYTYIILIRCAILLKNQLIKCVCWNDSSWYENGSEANTQTLLKEHKRIWCKLRPDSSFKFSRFCHLYSRWSITESHSLEWEKTELHAISCCCAEKARGVVQWVPWIRCTRTLKAWRSSWPFLN